LAAAPTGRGLRLLSTVRQRPAGLGAGRKALGQMTAMEPEAVKRRRLDSIAQGVRFTDNERQIVDLLKRVVRERNLNTTLRISGGWVRDKVCLL